MLVIIYIIRLLAPIVNTLGIIGLLTYGMYVCDYMIYFEDPSTYITENPTTKVIGTIGYANGMTFLYLSIGIFVIGIIFGVFAYKNDIPIRWFWAKSKNRLFSFSITTIIGYGLCFAAYPYAFFLVHYIINLVNT